jgi:adenine nucleotide transporter 17
VLGAVAKFAATVATYPLQLAQSRLRSQAAAASAAAATESGGGGSRPAAAAASSAVAATTTTLGCLAAVWRADGVAGLFNGFEAKIVQSVLTSALVFGSYETLLGLIVASSAPSAARAPVPVRR